MSIEEQRRRFVETEMRVGPAEGSPIGTSKWDIDTPALCVDLATLERNIAALQRKLAGTGVASRPHAKTHKCPAVARLQLAAGAIGICTATISEAEAMFAGGIADILMTTANVTANKIRRAMALRKANSAFVQAVDNPRNAHDLSDAAQHAGVEADVVVDVAIGMRSGVPADERALALAQLVDTLPNLTLRGVISYDGSAQHIKGFRARSEETRRRFEPSRRIVDAMNRSGLSTEIFSGGGTGTYSIMASVPGVTDVQAGSYVFMDCQYLEIGGEDNDTCYADFEPSLTVTTTVLNSYFSGRLTTDAGQKALTLNTPGPIVVGEERFTYDASSDEFGMIQYDTSNKSYSPGDKLELIVPHCDPVVNLYDRIYAIRDDRVEAIWPIAARGHSHRQVTLDQV
jgi:3-hydroxy-D-aspartate aldolase